MQYDTIVSVCNNSSTYTEKVKIGIQIAHEKEEKM